MLSGFNFAKRDLFSESDPFLILRCGDKVYNEEDNYQIDQRDPDFYKAYEFNVTFPGAPVLYIEAYDYDDFFGNDLIGISTLDLDDRFYNKDWISIENKPIEYRDLYHSSSKITQGVVKCWLEIDEINNRQALKAPADLTPEPVKEYEMRLVIWGGDDVEMMDIEDTVDAYVRSYVKDKEDHLTDTHYRNQDGRPNWNWRKLIKLQSQQPSYNLTV